MTITTRDRTPAERILSKLQVAGEIPWDGDSDGRLACGIELDAAESATLLAICREDWDDSHTGGAA